MLWQQESLNLWSKPHGKFETNRYLTIGYVAMLEVFRFGHERETSTRPEKLSVRMLRIY